MGITDIATDYAWSSHQPLIRMVLMAFNPGFVLELGIGKYSTPIFQAANCQKVYVENDEKWIMEMNIPGVLHHKINVPNQDIPVHAIDKDERNSIIDYYLKFADWIWEKDKPRLMVVDNYSCCRALAINILYPAFDFIIYHDCQPGSIARNNYYFSDEIKKQFSIYNLTNPKTWTGLLIRKPLEDEEYMKQSIQPFIDEYMIENNVPEMEFVKIEHYDTVQK